MIRLRSLTSSVSTGARFISNVSTTVKSSLPAGTPMKGIGFMKTKDAPVALEDHEYPEWLWGLLEKKKELVAAEGDLYAKSKKQRRLAARAALKAVKVEATIPLQEQSIDLPSGDGTIPGAVAASKARDELVSAMRKERKKTIKEKNFLTGMR